MPKKPNAPCRGARVDQAGGPGSTGKRKTLKCSNNHITRLRRALHSAGLLLGSTKTDTQIDALLKILLHLGDRGINTPEATGCGFARAATRIWDLEQRGWRIDTLREDVITADGLKHNGIARYVLRGRLADISDPQGTLDLGE